MADILGTIVASILDYDKLNDQLHENKGCDPKKSSYAPCDGRSIANSALAKLGVITAPDLRGRFLRGLNEIYSVEESGFDINTADSDDPTRTRKAGSYQADDFKSHDHPIDNKNSATRNTEKVDNDDNQGAVVCGDEFNNAPLTVLFRGGSETRPKNLAVYYYIKIN